MAKVVNYFDVFATFAHNLICQQGFLVIHFQEQEIGQLNDVIGEAYACCSDYVGEVPDFFGEGLLGGVIFCCLAVVFIMISLIA